MLIELDGTDRIVAVNDTYLMRTGHESTGVLGRPFWDELLSVGSRIFYHTQLAPVLQLDGRLDEVMVELTCASGERAPALMNVVRRRSPDQPIGTSIALMSVPDRRAFEDRLRQARDDAEQARRKADQARREADLARAEAESANLATSRAMEADAHARLRLELLSQANTALASSLDIDVALQRLSRVLASRLADWSLIRVPEPDQPTTARWSAAHTNPDSQADVNTLAEALFDDTRAESVLRPLLHAETPSLVAFSDAEQRRASEVGHLDAPYSTVGCASVISVPVVARRSHIASILLGRGRQRAPFSADDLADITDVAARTAIVIDNLRRQAREHSNSVALQNALLTTPPTGAGFAVATRYQPATNDNEVGGDWYDAFLQPDGALVLVIGDVIGHDIHAAAAMGQLRGIVRTLAYTTASSPADILTQADATARGLGVDTLATALVVRLTVDATGAADMQWSSAGHPPGLLVTESGVRSLSGDTDRLLGLPSYLQRDRHDHAVPLASGDTLVLFTDGLVERTDQTIDHSIATLARVLGGRVTADLDELCDAILDSRVSNIHDDIALIVARAARTD